jgi:hypothetical protein
MADRKTIAYHEAGHAVAHILLSVPFKVVTIKPDAARGSAGHVAPLAAADDMLATVSDTRQRRRVERHLITFCAGGAAEVLLWGDCEGIAGDDVTCSILADLICHSDEEKNALFVLSEIRARTIIKAAWAGVVAVADALLEHETLTARKTRKAFWSGFRGMAYAEALHVASLYR